MLYPTEQGLPFGLMEHRFITAGPVQPGFSPPVFTGFPSARQDCADERIDLRDGIGRFVMGKLISFGGSS